MINQNSLLLKLKVMEQQKLPSAKALSERIPCDSLGKNKEGNYVARRGFYYTMGKTADHYEKTVRNNFPMSINRVQYDIEVVKRGEYTAPFRGNATVKNSSHWYVEFKLIQVNS
jgi:hypothetical protein